MTNEVKLTDLRHISDEELLSKLYERKYKLQETLIALEEKPNHRAFASNYNMYAMFITVVFTFAAYILLLLELPRLFDSNITQQYLIIISLLGVVVLLILMLIRLRWYRLIAKQEASKDKVMSVIKFYLMEANSLIEAHEKTTKPSQQTNSVS